MYLEATDLVTESSKNRVLRFFFFQYSQTQTCFVKTFAFDVSRSAAPDSQLDCSGLTSKGRERKKQWRKRKMRKRGDGKEGGMGEEGKGKGRIRQGSPQFTFLAAPLLY